jgi:TATA-binding protein-associated factor
MQALPFILRREKSDVLTDLPPKITQDFYCDLSPLQIRIYDHFARAQQQQRQQQPNAAVKAPNKVHAFQVY